jgi:hypothetical protein
MLRRTEDMRPVRAKDTRPVNEDMPPVRTEDTRLMRRVVPGA